MTVGQLEREMTSSELSEWKVYFGILNSEYEMRKAGTDIA